MTPDENVDKPRVFFFLRFHAQDNVSIYRNSVIKPLISVSFLLLIQVSKESEYMKSEKHCKVSSGSFFG